MLATIMNCIYVSEIFRSQGMKTSVLTPFECGSFTKLFSKDRVNKYFAHQMVVFFCRRNGTFPISLPIRPPFCGRWRSRADTHSAGKAVDGVYDSDPKENPRAVKYDSVSIQEVIDKKTGGGGI